MKLRFFALCLLLCSLLTMVAFAAEYEENLPLLFDAADVLTDAEEQKIRNELNRISVDYDIIVMTVDGMEYEDVYDFAYDAYHGMEYRDGIMLLWRRGSEYNEYCFLPVGEGEKVFDDDVLDALEGDCVDHLRDRDFAEAFLTYADVCEEAMADYGRISILPILLCIVIGAILSFVIPMASLKGQLKSVRSKPSAQSYVRAGSFHLTTQRDMFLYHRVVRTPKPNKNSSSGRSGGGRSHAGRSGRC